MESEEGAAAQPPQTAAGEQTTGGKRTGRSSRRRQRRRRRIQLASQPQVLQPEEQQPQYPDAPVLYEQVAAALSSPPVGGLEFVTGREGTASSIIPGVSRIVGSIYIVTTQPSVQESQQAGDPGSSTTSTAVSSRSESSLGVLETSQSEAVAATQKISRSTKKRRKRLARKYYLKGLAEEKSQSVQHGSGSQEANEGPGGSASPTPQPMEGEGGGMEGPRGRKSQAPQCMEGDEGEIKAATGSTSPQTTEVDKGEMKEPTGSKSPAPQSMEGDGGGIQWPTGSKSPALQSVEGDEGGMRRRNGSKSPAPRSMESDECGMQGPTGSVSAAQQTTEGDEGGMQEPTGSKSPAPQSIGSGEGGMQWATGSKSPASQSMNSDEGEMQGPTGSKSLAPQSMERDEGGTQGPTGSRSPSPQHTQVDSVTLGAHGSSESENNPVAVDEAETHTEELQDSCVSTEQTSSHLGDWQNIPSSIAYQPVVTSSPMSFPSVDELCNHPYFGARTRSVLQAIQARRRSSTEIESAGAKEDIQSETGTTEISDSGAKDGAAARDRDGSNRDSSSPSTGSFRSSVDMEYLLEDNLRDVKQEREREEFVMFVVSNSSVVVSNIASGLTGTMMEVFGYQIGPYNSSNGTSYSGTVDAEVPEYDVNHERRLERLKASVQERLQLEASVEQQGPTNVEELTVELPYVTDSSELSEPTMPVHEQLEDQAEVEAISSESTHVEEAAHSSMQPDVITAELGEMSPHSSLLLQHECEIVALATIRGYKVRSSCSLLLSGLKTLMYVISLALDAYRVDVQTLERVIRPPYAFLNGLVRLVANAASSASELLHDALSAAEKAVRIYDCFIKSEAEMAELVAVLDHEQPTVQIPDRLAIVDRLVYLLDQTSPGINLDGLKAVDTATGSASTVPSASQGEGSAAAEEGSDSRETPLEGFEALLSACLTAVDGVEEATSSLEVVFDTVKSFRDQQAYAYGFADTDTDTDTDTSTVTDEAGASDDDNINHNGEVNE